MSSEKLKCCPFCSGHDVEICRTNENSCWVRCCSCFSESQSAETRKGAVILWNRRYYDDAPAIIAHDGDAVFWGHEGRATK